MAIVAEIDGWKGRGVGRRVEEASKAIDRSTSKPPRQGRGRGRFPLRPDHKRVDDTTSPSSISCYSSLHYPPHHHHARTGLRPNCCSFLQRVFRQRIALPYNSSFSLLHSSDG